MKYSRRLSRTLAAVREWFTQPIMRSHAAQEDWAARPLPRTARTMKRELGRLQRVVNPCAHLQQRTELLASKLMLQGELYTLPPMPPTKRRPASTAQADQFSVR